VSLRRQHPWLLKHVSAALLLRAGIAVLPAFLFQEALIVRMVQVAVFAWLAVVAGKRLQWIYFGTILVTVTFFHLLVPNGQILAQPLGLPITAGALRTGLYKGLGIVGMVFISLVSVRADLRLPGRVGAIVGRTFWCFEQIMERRSMVRARDPIGSVDTLFLSLHDDLIAFDDSVAETRERKGTAARSSVPGTIVVLAFVAIQWLLLALSYSDNIAILRVGV
jgi:heptaprenyl diphosphate synthase